MSAVKEPALQGGVAPHQNLAAEQAVLGALLFDAPKIATRLPASLQAEDFYRVPHQRLFRVLREMLDAGARPDLVTVPDWIREHGGDPAEVGGASYLAGLTDSQAFAANVEAHADIVLKAAQRRAAVHAAHQALSALQDPTLSFDDATVRASTALASIGRRRDLRRVREADVVRDVLRRAEDAFESGHEIRAFKTGLGALDGVFRPTPSDVITIAGYAGGGKSMLMAQIARVNCTGTGARPGLVANLEMDEAEMVERRFQDMGSMDLEDVLKPRSNEAATRLYATAEKIRATSRVEYFRAWDIAEIFREATRMKHELGDLAFVEVDYLQILDFAKDSGDTRDQQIGAATRMAKRWAAENRVPVIFGSQLRKPDDRGAPRAPSLHDLRESGNIGNDSNTVLILWTPGLIEGTKEHKAGDQRTVNVLVAKQRRGPAMRKVQVRQAFEHARFHDAVDEATEAEAQRRLGEN